MPIALGRNTNSGIKVNDYLKQLCTNSPYASSNTSKNDYFFREINLSGFGISLWPMNVKSFDPTSPTLGGLNFFKSLLCPGQGLNLMSIHV